MASLFATLTAAGNSLQAYQDAMSASSNNVSNSSVAGYAAQRVNFRSLDFDLVDGKTGGVTAGAVEDSRDRYAELSVQHQSSLSGYADASSQALSSLQNNFDVTGASGISAALSSLYQDFASWSTTASGTTQRNAVMNSAATVADAFRQTASGVQQQATACDDKIQSTVAKINTLATTIRDYNVKKLQGGASDAGQDAQLYQALEDLSNVINITPLTAQDGTITVLAGGQTPLVIGARANLLSADKSTGASGAAVVRNADGTDITSQLTGGQLGGLLDVRNKTLAGLIGTSSSPGSLDRLAKAFADRVNGLLQSGQNADGSAGIALFTYSDGNAASSIQVNPNITASKLAAASSTASNGVALALAGMPDSSASEDQIDGQTFSDFYASIAADVGSQTSAASSASTSQKQALTYAQNLRSEVSGVSLDDEAMKILEFQRAYQASSKMITVVDELTQTVLGLIT